MSLTAAAMTNFTAGKGKAVHAAHVQRSGWTGSRCGINAKTVTVTATEAPVTCKKCLNILDFDALMGR